MLHQKIGILGGGQLGKMLCEAASPLDLNISILDRSHAYPAATVAKHFVCGNFSKADDVFAFGKDLDVVTIEIESVSTEGLRMLEAAGVKTYPTADQLDIIKDKGKQNQFYDSLQIPTPSYELYDSAAAIRTALLDGSLSLPLVQKTRTEGYDGKGVQVIHAKEQLDNLWDGSTLVEAMVPIKKELAIIVARAVDGQTRCYDPVEMVFKEGANLVEFLKCPADVTPQQVQEIKDIATQIITELKMVGILAIEFFLDQEDQITVNEIAPRPHNSGHHTIEACYCSQYEQHLRAILGLPLGSTKLRSAAVMINLLGAEGFQGPAKVVGAEDILALEGVYIHLYGKKDTRPNRKMGHITFLHNTSEGAEQLAKTYKERVQIKA